MEQPKSTNGGKREGSGRKPFAEGEVLKPMTIKISAQQREKLAKLGGAPWVREKIDKANIPE